MTLLCTAAIGARWPGHYRRHRYPVKECIVSPPQQPVALETAAQEFADATSQPPLIYQLSRDIAREVLEAVQRSPIDKPDADIEDITIPVGPHDRSPSG
jgi:hypothetical protein